jgi:hypothetical protein
MSNYRNTVQSCVAKFLRNKHRDEFMALNPWMDITVAAVVFFRRHTSHKLAYATYKDLFKQDMSAAHHEEYIRGYYSVDNLKWWQIPVSQKQCAGIKPATLAKYAGIIASLSDQYQDVP